MLSRYILIVCCLVVLCKCVDVFAIELSVVWSGNDNAFEVVEEQSENFVSNAHFVNEINTTGWSFLEIRTNSRYPDRFQAYAAGLAEGYATSELIDLSQKNLGANQCSEPLTKDCKKLKHFIDTNFAWVQEQIDSFASIDAYWHQVNLFLHQLQGLIDGYNHVHQTPANIDKFRFKPDITGLLMFQIMFDVGDLKSALKLNATATAVDNGRCTSLVKLAPGNEDLYAGHVTMTGFNMLLRTMKKYSFGYHLIPDSPKLIPGAHMTFTSYPGVLFSVDDFYTMSSGIVAMETTTAIFNEARWKFVHPVGTVFEGIRNIAANRLASSCRQWADLFSQYNSGTYNNQWTIVDYKKFVPGADVLQPNLIWIVEQIPGLVKSQDITDLLSKQTYFGSYNVPFSKETYVASGFDIQAAKFGDFFTYEHTPRANMLRRDYWKVYSVETMLKLLRYNDYQHDPLSRCNCTPPYSAEFAMSARGDLNPENGTYPFGAIGHRNHGGIDTKVTSSLMMKSLEFVAVSSPTYDSVPPFQWSTSSLRDSVSHVGHPDLWKFDPVQHRWRH